MLTPIDAKPRGLKETPGAPLRALAAVLREEFGAPFRLFDARTGEPVGSGDDGEDGTEARAGDAQARREARAEVVPLPDGRLQIRLPIADGDGPGVVAVGLLPALARTPAEAELERTRLRKWAQAVRDRLSLVASAPARRRPADPSPPAARAWEALLGLEHLLSGFVLHREPERNRRRVLRVAAGQVEARAVAWAPVRGRGEAILEGEAILSPWDCGQLADLLSLEPSWRDSGFLLCNRTAEAAWGARFPRVEGLVAVPLPEKEPIGWVIALNKRGDGASGAGAFQRMDAALLSPFAALLGLSLRSYDRYQSLKDLLVGLTRSLTAAIDAKDPYTFGHSERVARIAVVLGQELGLKDEELSDIYLAGLLHDIGKIGIRDAVLGRRGPLTDEEMAHIRQHVVIGHRILSNLRPIGHLLPGVLYHHERYDGKGYPEGLAGEMIPLLARIVAVADSYDAMSTCRPYRAALPPAVIEKTLNEGAGSQWDRRIIDAFTRCREKVHAIRQRGVGESLRGALDDAMRDQDGVGAGWAGLPGGPNG